MKLTRDEWQARIQDNKITSEDLEQIVRDQEDAEKYRQLKEKIKQIENDSYLLDRLDACDTSGASEILREFLDSK
ncbi:MAG: hypothetical protein KC483_07060 [Nitrosarchaeum sp.]|nr:hypothetical protein [Nitrosarchaeum sp.]MCA9820548.1 hypothetical protein [Nitrosarchaeum sp.]